MTPAALAIELELDRIEAMLAPEWAAGAHAYVERALVDRRPSPPPWPAWLTSAAAARLARDASARPEPELAIRGRTLARWSLAARLDEDPAMRAARAAPRTLAGLATRHAAFADAALRFGYGSSRRLADGLYGAVPGADARTVAETETETEAETVAETVAETETATVAETETATVVVPDARTLIAAFAARHGLATAGVDLRPGSGSLTVTIAPGHARSSVGRGDDALATLALALHEAGHALYRAQQNGGSLLAAEPPSRWFDEAIAAWTVRALEDPELVPDPALRREAAARRRRRERRTAELAAFEAAAFAGADVLRLGAPHLARDERGMAGTAALFDEPGVMVSYLAADRTPPPFADGANGQEP